MGTEYPLSQGKTGKKQNSANGELNTAWKGLILLFKGDCQITILRDDE